MSPWSTFAVKYWALERWPTDTYPSHRISATGGATNMARCIIDRSHKPLRISKSLDILPDLLKAVYKIPRSNRALQPAAGADPRPSGAIILQISAADPALAVDGCDPGPAVELVHILDQAFRAARHNEREYHSGWPEFDFAGPC